MKKPIHIIDDKAQIEMAEGIYSLKVLGGWKVNANSFSVLLREVGAGIEIKPQNVFWKEQSFAFGKRAKTIARFTIPKRANYEIMIINPTELKIKKSNLILLSSFQHYVPTNEIQICIV